MFWLLKAIFDGFTQVMFFFITSLSSTVVHRPSQCDPPGMQLLLLSGLISQAVQTLSDAREESAGSVFAKRVHQQPARRRRLSRGSQRCSGLYRSNPGVQRLATRMQ